MTRYEHGRLQEGPGFLPDNWYIHYVRVIRDGPREQRQELAPIGPFPKALAAAVCQQFFQAEALCPHGLRPGDCHACCLSDFGCYTADDYEQAGF